jgi:hypothetical protein
VLRAALYWALMMTTIYEIQHSWLSVMPAWRVKPGFSPTLLSPASKVSGYPCSPVVDTGMIEYYRVAELNSKVFGGIRKQSV